MPDRVPTAAGDNLPMQNLLAARGGCIGNVEVVDLMGLEDSSIVDRWRDHRQIVSVRDDAGQWVYPIWQFVRKHKRIMLGIRDCLAERAFFVLLDAFFAVFLGTPFSVPRYLFIFSGFGIN